MLGRGLESLIPKEHQNEAETPVNTELTHIVSGPPRMEGPIFHIEVDKIESNPHQPRKHFDETALKELASSISEFGIMQPLVVTKIETPTEHGINVRYQLIAGERRLLASKMVGLATVPVIVRAVPEEKEKLELAIVENLQRANLSPIETARAYAKLQDHFGLTQREISVRVGKSREVVGNSMRLLSLPTYIQEALSKGQISESQGRLLLVVEDSTAQQRLFHDIVTNNLSVRELKLRIARTSPKSSRVAREEDPILKSVEERLEEYFGTKVKLQKQGDSGKIMIDFYSVDELNGILEKLLVEKIQTQLASEGVDGGGVPPQEEFHV